MRVVFFSTKPYEEPFFCQANTGQHELIYLSHRLDSHTSQSIQGCHAICAFVNDDLGERTLDQLHRQGVKLIALRCAGYNNVDLSHAKKLGLTIVHVPSYSPHAVAEYAVGLVLALNRKIHRAYHRVRELDFSLHGLMGFDLYKKTIGVLGVGQIGAVFAQIMAAFGCRVIAYDPAPSSNLIDSVCQVDINQLFEQSDIISLHCPLAPATQHIIGVKAISQMKKGVMLINTGRGGLINTKAVIDGLKSGQIGSLGLDVYEEESALFFQDQSDQIIQDDTFTRLLTFPNVIITGHQAYFTEEALHNIAEATLKNITAFEKGSGEFYRIN